MPNGPSNIRKHAFAYTVLAAFFVLVVTAFVRNVSDTVDLVQHGSEYARPPFYLGDANWGAIAIQPEAEAVGLRYGDAILAVNDQLFHKTGDGVEVARLETGGPVIGLIEGCVYHQATVTLAPGDVLVAYTDGLSEAMNAANDEWGEERFMDAILPNRAMPASTLIDRLMTSADAFVAGAPQHDDMTLLVVKALEK